MKISSATFSRRKRRKRRSHPLLPKKGNPGQPAEGNEAGARAKIRAGERSRAGQKRRPGKESRIRKEAGNQAKEPPVARQLTSTPAFKSAAQFTPDSKEVFYLEDSKIKTVALESRQPNPLGVSAEMDVDFARLRVTGVVPLGPAAIAGVKVGDEILAVDGAPIGPHVNLDELLQHKIGRRVVLKLKNGAEREAVVRPIDISAEKNLLCREWVGQQRAYVDKMSGGKLGYVHMADMSANSLQQLYVDLDGQNEGRQGVVVDVRNNNGGFVNVYAIDVLARHNYLNMLSRGMIQAPARPVLGQRALERPTILVTNRHSLWDAEDFTEGYRALHLGKVVGEPTAGWIIYTTGTELIDGSVVRLPYIRITTATGEPMEMHPRPVDVEVRRPIGEGLTGRDSELDAAVGELLQEIAAWKFQN
jgi:C-terminal processing protease CtpA/Prc